MDSSNDYILKIFSFIRVSADYYYPEWGCLVDFFAIMGWTIAGMSKIEPTTLDLDSKSGAFEHSGTLIFESGSVGCFN